MPMDWTFLLRRDTQANWTSVNPILGPGEPGVVLPGNLMKIGDGTNHWLDLPYLGMDATDAIIASIVATGTLTQDAIAALPISDDVQDALDLLTQHLADEVTARQAAGVAFGIRVDDEIADREAADAVLEQKITNGIPSFGDIMKPYSQELLSPGVATVTNRVTAPTWWDGSTWTRWDNAAAFTYSGTPVVYVDGLPDFGALCKAGTITPKAQDITFTASGPRCAPKFLSFGVQDVKVWVNGRPASYKTIPTADGFVWLDIQFKNLLKHANIRVAGCFIFCGVLHDPSTTIQALKPIHTMAVVSDSYFENTLVSYSDTLAVALASATGFRIINLAQGGTGYANDGGGLGGSTMFGSAQRMALLALYQVDSILVWGTGNDGGEYLSFPATAETYYAQIAAAKPGVPVVVAGVEPVAQFRGVVGESLNDRLETAATNSPNVVGFINSYDEHWLTGTGDVEHPAGNGNQDWNITSVDITPGIHLGDQGALYFGDKTARDLALIPSRIAA